MTWTKGKYFEGNQLLDRGQINTLLSAFCNEKIEQFVTIQDYNASGEIIGCPLYFDIDAPSLLDAYEDMQDLCEAIEDELQAPAIAWFSGGKGFHVMSPLYVRHPRCHEIVKMIWKDLFNHIDCDPKVYRTRAMFRVENTWNIKGDAYKIPINWKASLVDILNGIKEPKLPAWRLNWRSKDMDISEYVDRLPTYSTKTLSEGVEFQSMMPCLSKLWEMEVPPEGSRHELAYLFIRHCFRSGLDRNDTSAMFAAHPFWKHVEQRDYEKIINSVYNSGHVHMGCKNNKLLQDNCFRFCKYNEKQEEFSEMFKTKG